MADDGPLFAALTVIQARGAIGGQPLPDAVAHADRFVSLIPPGARTVVDLGSGGGLPALVIAWRRPDLEVVMVERRATRADLLRRAVAALELGGRARVVNADVAVVADEHLHGFDAVTSRSFGEPAVTVGFVDRLLADDGIALVSEPPADRSDVWAAVLSDERNLADGGVEQGIRILRRPAPST